MPDHGEPRRAITTWQRSVVLDEYATHDILIDLESERARYLLCILSAAVAEVASFHLDDRVDEFS